MWFVSIFAVAPFCAVFFAQIDGGLYVVGDLLQGLFWVAFLKQGLSSLQVELIKVGKSRIKLKKVE